MKKFLVAFILLLWNTQTFAQVIISEIAWMGTVASHYDEWIEIFNSGSESIDLTNWTLETKDNSPSIAITGTINPNEFLLFERTDDNAISLPAHQTYSGGLSNDGEVLFLKNTDGDIIDQTPNTLPWVAGNNLEKKTMERAFPIADGTKESSWHTFSLETSAVLDADKNPILGSPGSESSPPAEVEPPFSGKIFISEISNNHKENDFIELFAKDLSEEFDGQYMEIKHNGTQIFFAEKPLTIKENDFLTLDLTSKKIQEAPVRYQNTTTIRETGDIYSWESASKNGLNGSSGTIELNLFVDTENEMSADFLCWAKENLSETEQNRLDKNIPDNWNGPCVNIAGIIQNESIARREPQSDGNTNSDFMRHFNGTPGSENIPNNQPPVAKFYIQGSPNITTSANLSAIDEDNFSNGSFDSDGQQDLKNFSWTVNGKKCGDFNTDGWEWRKTRNGEAPCDTILDEEMEWKRANPDRIYFNFEKQPTFEINITVEDFSGEVDTFSDTITKTIITRHGSNGAFESSIKSWLKKEFSKEGQKKKESKIKNEYQVDGFFEDFLLTVSPEELVSISYRIKEIPYFNIPKTRTALFQREKYTNAQRARMRKNIGLSVLAPHATAWGKLLDQTDPTETEPLGYSPQLHAYLP